MKRGVTGARAVALLRAVNVGGRNRVPMADLRTLLEKTVGLTGVSTYVQSGNAVFDHRSGDPDALAGRIEAALRKRFRFDVRVVVRTREELARIVRESPFVREMREPKQVHVAFLSAVPADPTALDARSVEPDRFAIRGRNVHLWYPDGAGKARLTGALLERRLGVAATARNWNTVTELSRLTSE